MSKTILIDPVTRIEGHSKITITLDDQGAVTNARFHVTQFRGFETFCVGRPFEEMPALTARTCGICPVSHLVASAKAGDMLLAVDIPPAAKLLRRVLNTAQMIQSHALSFFYLSSPDLVLGMDADPAERHILGLAAKHEQIARNGITLRQFGQQLIEDLAGKRIHPAWVVPGGVSRPMTEDQRANVLAKLPAMLDIARQTLDAYEGWAVKFADEIQYLGQHPSLYMGLVTDDGGLEHYDGHLRMIDADGAVLESSIPALDYADHLEEHVEPDSYLKSPYYKAHGFPGGMYRVGPLARINIAQKAGTPIADQAFQAFRQINPNGPVDGTFHYHHARLIEIIFGLERMREWFEDPLCVDTRVRAVAAPNNPVGVGISEAPRGTLLHHYEIDKHGLITKVNMIIATGHNNLAMNAGILQAAKQFVRGDKIPEGALNRVEAVIRCFDPCLSCSTHAYGQMPLKIELQGPGGIVLDTVMR
ncbi:MAG TPA: Ni/Fe hydrogenase subunit alpha [Kiritimatiellia bacterium]|nr:Ni/Fe hydrogenase subunit alpha [Kiritimatiellia bacterium]HMO99993.1 Ni/Fe hydrogenase subunit alpha [Kiritimatiellia bacterium]HMP74497.1 Ni/Fe hydrogenase subunit alpha [Kiritimatiellia bacterium]